jgi:fatty acid amide hydrolase 2
MPHTGGCWHRRDKLSPEDATAVGRLREAGAIALGVTNVPELAMWSETYNSVYGRTSNPWDQSRTAGGSSGGEAAIIGAGGAPFGIGSDIGGSIRMPAYFCGVFGHKPTGGAVPLTGHYPRATGDVGRYCVAGPLTRKAKDLMPLLRIMAGPDGKDPATIDLAFEEVKGVDFKKRRVLTLLDLNAKLSVGPTSEVRNTVERAAMALEGKGAKVETFSSPLFREAVSIWAAMIAQDEGTSFGEMLGDGKSPSYLLEFMLMGLGLSKHTLPALIFGCLEKVFKGFDVKRMQRFIELGHRLRADLEDALAGGAILIAPTHPRLAPKHKAPLLRPLDFIYTAIFNVLEVPVTAVPMGLGAGCLPMGVQIAAGHGQDHLSIAAAMTLDQVVGGWSLPHRSLFG